MAGTDRETVDRIQELQRLLERTGQWDSFVQGFKDEGYREGHQEGIRRGKVLGLQQGSTYLFGLADRFHHAEISRKAWFRRAAQDLSNQADVLLEEEPALKLTKG